VDPFFNKFNQHYVPRFWQKRFADSKNEIYVRYGASFDPDQNPRKRGRARVVGVADTMTKDFTYTVYDNNYRPYDVLENDVLENLLSEAEGEMRQTQGLILDPQTVVSTELRTRFCWGIALSICRLPHVMKQAHRKRIELTFAYCEIGNLDRQAFEAKLADYGQTLSDEEYEALKARPI
jgi:hypothetical protein